MEHAPWYHGDATREYASALLRLEPPGSFLVRRGGGGLAASYVIPSTSSKLETVHSRILVSARGYALELDEYVLQPQPTLSALIAHAKSVFLHPVAAAALPSIKTSDLETFRASSIPEFNLGRNRTLPPPQRIYSTASISLASAVGSSHHDADSQLSRYGFGPDALKAVRKRAGDCLFAPLADAALDAETAALLGFGCKYAGGAAHAPGSADVPMQHLVRHHRRRFFAHLQAADGGGQPGGQPDFAAAAARSAVLCLLAAHGGAAADVAAGATAAALCLLSEWWLGLETLEVHPPRAAVCAAACAGDDSTGLVPDAASPAAIAMDATTAAVAAASAAAASQRTVLRTLWAALHVSIDDVPPRAPAHPSRRIAAAELRDDAERLYKAARAVVLNQKDQHLLGETAASRLLLLIYGGFALLLEPASLRDAARSQYLSALKAVHCKSPIAATPPAFAAAFSPPQLGGTEFIV